MILLQPLVDILYIDDGIVHKRTYGNAHTAKSHCIYIHAKQIENNYSSQERQWDSKERNHRCTQACKEQEEHQYNAHCTLNERTAHVVHGRLYIIGLTENLGIDRNIGRQ